MALTALFALAAAAAASVPSSSTPQQDFDTASAAAASGDCAKAVPLFEALERSGALKLPSLPASAVAVRKGQCLLALGRKADAAASIRTGLPGLESAGEDFKVDVAQAYSALGTIALGEANFSAAKEAFRKARDLQVPFLRMTALAGLIKASLFDAGPEPLALADEGLRIAAAEPKPSKDALAAFRALKARILLNRGETEAAYNELKQSLALSGGLTMRTTLSEASMRGDLALAAMLLGRREEARKYLAYTGAGRIAESPFATAVAMSPPDCGTETGLRPEDFAVVEFGIADDGSVSAVETTYSRGGPAVAAAFARAVGQWYWRPESIAKIPDFYRLVTRVELRCSTAGGPAPSVMKPLTDRFAEWAKPHFPELDGASSVTESISRLRLYLTADGHGKDATKQIAAIGLLTILDFRKNADTVAQLDQAILLSGPAQLPRDATNALQVFRLLALPYTQVRGKKSNIWRISAQSVNALLARPELSEDPLASDTLRLLSGAESDDLVNQVANDDRLASHHPLRQLALLTLANHAASAGNLDQAQAFFARTGLSEQQCALIGPKPDLRRSGANSGDFPMEAMRYGFEGWVSLEFDISADGTTANARPIIAYPPFVFVDAAKGMTRDIRYSATYRPNGGVACNANRETIKFILP